MPWARGFCPFRACGAYLRNLSESIIKLKKIVYILSGAKIIVLLHLIMTKEDWQSDRMRWTRNPVYPLSGIGGLNPSSSATFVFFQIISKTNMKKFIIPIMMLLPLTMQAQTVLTEQQQLEEAQKQLEAAKKALQIAKMKAEAARLKAQTDSLNQEAAKAEAEAKQMEAKKAEIKQAEAQKAEIKQAEAQKAEAEPAPNLPKEEAVTKGGWAIPTTVAKKKEEAKPVLMANGVELKEDPKYLEGAVKLNQEGKVEFTLDTDANGKTAKQIYNIVYEYMSDLTQSEENIGSRVALVNPNEYIIANSMDEWLVFSSSFISLDRSEFKYQLVAKIADNHLNLKLLRISYNYEEDRPTGFKAPAEKVITDKVALTKKKNDLAKIFGKFRKKTIDRKDQIFSEITALVKN